MFLSCCRVLDDGFCVLGFAVLLGDLLLSHIDPLGLCFHLFIIFPMSLNREGSRLMGRLLWVYRKFLLDF